MFKLLVTCTSACASFSYHSGLQQTANGSTRGLEDLSVTSGDRAVHFSKNGTAQSMASQGFSTTQSVPTTQTLEAKSMPQELNSTLEHIVGQLDILTQVSGGGMLLLPKLPSLCYSNGPGNFGNLGSE